MTDCSLEGGENMETATDHVVDEIIKICLDVKTGNQVQALWKVFNLMAEFIKIQANLITAMDGAVKLQQKELAALKEKVREMGESVKKLQNVPTTIH